MKDAQGHGSNGRNSAQRFARWNEGVKHGMKGMPERSPNDSDYVAGHRYGTNHVAISNYDASKALGQGHPKAEAVPTHEAQEYNRDLTLRLRNGQVGSGMKYRG